MSTKTPNSQNDTAPGDWFATDAELDRWRHPSGSIVRIRRELPIVDAASCNRGERVDADGELVVLAHSDPLPSEASEVHRGGTVEDAREAARTHMLQHPEGV